MNTKAVSVFKYFKRYWALLFIVCVYLVQIVVMYGYGEHIYASTHDNLELHILDYHLLSKNNLFFSHNGTLPILNGISRDYFFTEFSVYSFLYMILPTCYAYITGYCVKTIIGMLSCILLAKCILKNNYYKYFNLIILISFAFSSLPFYPAFSLCFASLPLFIYIIIQLNNNPRKKWFLLLFLYPIFSYFTFFGVFLIGYLFIFSVIISIKNKKVHIPLLLAPVILFLGYSVMEYRLFRVMLFSNVVTIRSTMVMDDWNFIEILKQVKEVYIHGIFHAESCHTYLIAPICTIALVLMNGNYILRKKYKQILIDPLNITILFIFFNCMVYGLYGCKFLREIIETVIPIIKGLQLNRTVFFNTILWYIAFFIVLVKLKNTKYHWIANYLAILSVIVVVLTPAKYNDFYHTSFNHFYKMIKQSESNNLDFNEYYSANLIESIKKDINYNGEKSVAFGLNPAVLEYSNIWTLDGCISYYSQEYKDEFRKLIAPALALNEENKIYYDDWGARAYIYSASSTGIYDAVRNYKVEDHNLYMDTKQFIKMGGKYIFSRIEISNAEEKELNLLNTYRDKDSPYVIYLYRVR